MEKSALVPLLNKSFDGVQQWYANQNDLNFVYRPSPEKWTAGQHALHLLKSAAALEKVLRINKWFLWYKFGKNNRQERDYIGLQKRYKQKLEKASPSFLANNDFSPDEVTVEDKEIILNKLEQKRERIIKNMSRWNESQLSTFVAPHPALGKMTIRELIYFIAFHNDHHVDVLNNGYLQNS